MGAFSKHGWARRIIRWSRRTLLVLAALAIAIVAWINYVGVPAFLKAKLRAEIRQQGWQVDFSELRVRRWREIQLENFSLSRANPAGSPRLSGQRAVVTLDPFALFGGAIFQNVTLESGALEWPFYSPENQEPFAVTNIQIELGSLPERNWSFGAMRGRTRGLDFELTGAVKPLNARKDKPPNPLGRDWDRWQRQIGEALRRIEQFETPQGGKLRVSFDGDLEDLASLRTALKFQAPLARTPFAEWTNLTVTAHISAATNRGELRAEAALSSEGLRSQAGTVGQLNLTASSVYPLGTNAPIAASAKLVLANLATDWARAENFSAEMVSRQDPSDSNLTHRAVIQASSLVFKGTEMDAVRLSLGARHESPGALTDAHNLAEHTLRSFQTLAKIPQQLPEITNSVDGEFNFAAARVKTSLAEAIEVRGEGRFSPNLAAPDGGEALAFWNYFLGWQFTAGVQTDSVRVTNILASDLTANISWAAPALALTNFQASIGGRQLAASGELDILSRRASARTAFNIDARQANSLLTPSAQRWLAQYTWEAPPDVEGRVSVTLPAWNDAKPAWEETVLPTLALEGRVEGGPGAFRGARAEHVSTDLLFTNLQWTLPNLIITRPEGRTEVSYWNHVQTRDYWWKLKGRLDPLAIAPLLDPPERKLLNFFEFTQPPQFDAQIWGQWGNAEDVALKADLFLTNMSFRAQPARSIKASLSLTNHVLTVTNLDVIGTVGHAHVPLLEYHPAQERIFITNGFSTLEPMKVARALGGFAVRAIEDYVFLEPPTVHVNGWVPAGDDADADVHFTVSGGPFHYWKFNIPQVEGKLHWKADDLAIREVRGPFYGGNFQFSGDFHFPDEQDSADFKFTSYVQGAELGEFVRDVLQKTNKMAGRTEALLVVTSANSDDMKSWAGYGQASLTNGFLWDVPVFGFFSPMFDAVSSGLGRSEIKSANMTFMMTNSVLHTRDLELRSDAFRLHYNGSVDFDANVNARVEAELFRDTFLVGRLFSAALWPVRKAFIYKVSGTLNEPLSEPLFIPKFLLAPFRAREIISEFEARSITARWRRQQEQMIKDTEKAMEAAEKEGQAAPPLR